MLEHIIARHPLSPREARNKFHLSGTPEMFEYLVRIYEEALGSSEKAQALIREFREEEAMLQDLDEGNLLPSDLDLKEAAYDQLVARALYERRYDLIERLIATQRSVSGQATLPTLVLTEQPQLLEKILPLIRASVPLNMILRIFVEMFEEVSINSPRPALKLRCSISSCQSS